MQYDTYNIQNNEYTIKLMRPPDEFLFSYLKVYELITLGGKV